MSRKEIVGEKLTIAFGVDHATGAFVQLWKNPINDQDASIVKIDSFGISGNKKSKHLSEEVRVFLDQTQKRFDLFKQNRPSERPNIDEQIVIDMAKHAGGFPDIAKEVYQIFND